MTVTLCDHVGTCAASEADGIIDCITITTMENNFSTELAHTLQHESRQSGDCRTTARCFRVPLPSALIFRRCMTCSLHGKHSITVTLACVSGTQDATLRDIRYTPKTAMVRAKTILTNKMKNQLVCVTAADTWSMASVHTGIVDMRILAAAATSLRTSYNEMLNLHPCGNR